MKKFEARTSLASWILLRIASLGAEKLFAGSDYRQPAEARAHEHTPDCTCTRCDAEFFEDEMCPECGYCLNCCTCTATAAPTDPDDNSGDDDECPYYDDDKRSTYWYAARAHFARFEANLGEE